MTKARARDAIGPPPFKDAHGNVMAYIDDSGDLFLYGDYEYIPKEYVLEFARYLRRVLEGVA
jgi:hypothetical protein